MQLFSKQLPSWINPADAFVLLYAKHQHAFWLDREHNKSNPFSVIGGSAGLVSVSDFSDIQHHLSGYEATYDQSLPFDFRPGLVGALSFELDSNLMMSVNQAIVFDHSTRTIWFVGLFESESDFEDWTFAALLRFALVGGQLSQYRSRNSQGSSGSVRLRHSGDAYLALISAAQRRIAAGDVYQLCLTNEISLESDLDPFEVFLRLRESNPAPYSCYLRADHISIVCASPEQFLTATADGELSSKPIKGTRRRGENGEEDLQIIDELRFNDKERAENLMIVDLMRNDLGRVSKVESVVVEKLFDVETYATVHQLVSTVKATLREGSTSVDAIRAAFPGGSMTGAPKIKAVEIIKELEAGDRGIYSGAIGYIGANGALELGMVIRTLVFNGSTVKIGVGGGITIDSDPQAELEETRLKAKALLGALDAADPWA